MLSPDPSSQPHCMYPSQLPVNTNVVIAPETQQSNSTYSSTALQLPYASPAAFPEHAYFGTDLLLQQSSVH